MFGHGERHLIVGVDQREQGIVVRRRILGADVHLNRSGSRLTAFRKFLDQIVPEQFARRGRLDHLKKQFCRCLGFLYPRGQLMWRRETLAPMLPREIVLLALCITGSAGSL